MLPALRTTVAAAVIVGSGRVLLIRRQVPGSASITRLRWQFPAGAIEAGEETGVHSGAVLRLGEQLHPTIYQPIAYIACQYLSGTAYEAAAPGEVAEVAWAPVPHFGHHIPLGGVLGPAGAYLLACAHPDSRRVTMRTLTVLNWNFENNGGGDPAKWAQGHDLLVQLNPDLLFRQEPWDAADNGHMIHNQQEDVLGLRGWIGARSRTAVYADPSLFASVRDWRDNVAPMWVQPPTPMLLRYQPAGSTAIPFVAVSYHLHYCSVTNRASEAESLTAYADRKWRTHDGRKITPPTLVGGDNNSYPHLDLPGAPSLPDLSSIKDKRHMVHRSRLLPDGSRIPDTDPDKTLRDAELFDLARYWAEKSGDINAVARTVNASNTQGGDSRIDRVYGSPHFLPAVIGVDVIEVHPDLSDHHVVRVKLDRDILADVLNEQQGLGT